jgi:iron complex outermembrane receptor protein
MTPCPRRRRRAPRWRAAALGAFPLAVAAQADPPGLLLADHTLDRVVVTGSRPSTLPLEIPTSTEGTTGEAIERTTNATDSEDALKYFPSLSVRKRYIGDYDHAVLATRASGTGNSARSLVYADGMLLSNLLGNGATFTPRWGLVTPEEIERVDVLYGPFSAAYSGNSAGAIVDYVTRMPRRFEAHVKLQAFSQRYRLYGTDDRFSGGQGSASLGDRAGAWSWWISVNRMDSQAQPITFANKLVPATTSSAGTPVTGAVLENNPRGQPWVLFGATGQTHTVQDHAKLKLAYDVSPTLRATYTLGYWRNDADRGIQSFVRDASGRAVTQGTVNVDNHSYTLNAADFAETSAALEHLAHGLSLKRHTGGVWDWEFTASRYDYQRDRTRSSGMTVPVLPAPAPFQGITDMGGTGWTTLALKGIWRPDPASTTHVVEGGLQRDAFRLRSVASTTSDWRRGEPQSEAFRSTGDTTLQSLWGQDAWRFAPRWRAVLGGRFEQWQASNGSASSPGVLAARYADRRESAFSPKAAVSFQASDEWALKASLGRAVRMPTVSELYQGSIAAGGTVNNDPGLKPEKSWTSELSAERAFTDGLLRATLFVEHTRDALYSQTNVTVSPNVTNIQNVDAIRTRGVELAYRADNVGIKGLELSSSLTYADSKITRNDKFPASVGQRQPRVPLWRANLLASYSLDDRWSASFGARYSGRQFGQLDNSDTHDMAYTGFSRFFVTDLRLRYRFARQWTASLGVDNLNNATYWAFHPYPQRSVNAELSFDL